MFIFSSFGLVIFLVLTLDQNRKSPHVMMAGEEFNSFINPIWDKAGSHIVGIAEFLQHITMKGNIIDNSRRDLFPNPTLWQKELLWAILIYSP